MMPRMRRRSLGVTLIELMITITLIAVLALLALPMGNEWLANSRIRTAGESMLAGIQFARAEAVRLNTTVVFELDTDGGNPNSGWKVSANGAVLQQRDRGEGTRDVVVETSPDGATVVAFNGLGRKIAIPGADSFDRVNIDLPASVLPSTKTRDLQIQIGVAGQVVMCDPNVGPDDVRKCPS